MTSGGLGRPLFEWARYHAARRMGEALVTFAGAYLACGLVFAAAFAARGAARIDPDARGATLGFRVLVIPGAMLLWPALLVRWVRGALPPIERNAHRVGPFPVGQPNTTSTPSVMEREER